MHEFIPTDYGPVLSTLVNVDRCRPLDAGAPDNQRRAAIQETTLATAFAHAKVVDRDMARCCLAGVWLLHDFLDESHKISQDVDATSGSFWHGIMHRREGDFSNAKYWFRRVGSHEVFDELGRRVTGLAAESNLGGAADRIALNGRFDPIAIVDACQAAVRSGRGADFLRRVQQAEWELLFDHCYRRAVGT